MFLGFVLDVVISRLKVVVDDRVGSFTVEADFAIGTSKDDRHPFTDVVEIQNAEQFVDFRLSHCLKTKIHTLTMTRWEKRKKKSFDTSIVMESGVRALKTNPKFRAAETSAPSSGDWAWYSSLPIKETTNNKKKTGQKFNADLPFFSSGMTVWQSASRRKNS